MLAAGVAWSCDSQARHRRRRRRPCLPRHGGDEEGGAGQIEKIAPELLDGALASGGTHVEHYEIATYEGLITDAGAMGEDAVVALLQENLEQEQHTLQEVTRATQRLAQTAASKSIR